MDDLTIVKRCAEAMGWQNVRVNVLAMPGIHKHPPFVVSSATGTSVDELYDPLHDDAQAMALVKKFHLIVEPSGMTATSVWWVQAWHNDRMKWEGAENADLNRAICECIANLKSESGE